MECAYMRRLRGDKDTRTVKVKVKFKTTLYVMLLVFLWSLLRHPRSLCQCWVYVWRCIKKRHSLLLLGVDSAILM
jgi:hypothetical protein